MMRQFNFIPGSAVDTGLFVVFVLTVLSLILIVCVLIFTAFVTVFERKILGGIQKRKGPNVTGFIGSLQAIADGVKLFTKETIIPSRSDVVLFILAPLIVFCFSLSMWSLLPLFPRSFITNLNMGLVIFFALSLLAVYGILLAGWSSNSRLPFYGALRSVAQMLAYDLSLGVNLLIVVLYARSFRLYDIAFLQYHTVWLFALVVPSACVFFICVLAELKRIPFDLPEAESELVSGYNTEYSGFLFAFFFLAEYSSLILFANFFVILYMGAWSKSTILLSIFGSYPYFIDFIFYNLKVLFVIFLFIALRGTVARYRYDTLMEMGWKVLLPLSLAMFIVFFCLAMTAEFFASGSIEPFVTELTDLFTIGKEIPLTGVDIAEIKATTTSTDVTAPVTEDTVPEVAADITTDPGIEEENNISDVVVDSQP